MPLTLTLKPEDIIKLEDGYAYYWTDKGAMSAHNLRTLATNLRKIATKLDKINKPWDDQVQEFLS